MGSSLRVTVSRFLAACGGAARSSYAACGSAIGTVCRQVSRSVQADLEKAWHHCRSFLEATKTHRLAVFYTGLLLVVLIIIIPKTIEDFAYVESWKFWFQTAAGNWSANPFAGQGQYSFGLSAVIAVLLNNGLLFIIIAAAWNAVATERKRLMDLAKALKQRDSVAIATIQTDFLKKDVEFERRSDQ